LTIKLSGGEPGHTVSYNWEGARPVTSWTFASTAEFKSKKPGLYTITVTPHLDGVAKQPFHVQVRVLAIRPEKIRVQMTDPPGAVTYVGRAFTCHGVTEPADFASLVEWSAPEHTTAWGVGPSFKTSRWKVGDQYPIVASLASTPAPPSARVMVYEAKWVKRPTEAEYFIAPTVRLHYEVRTDPPGYESRVRWMFDSMHTAEVSPATGQGSVFEPVVTPHIPGQLWRMVEADNLEVSGDPVATLSCTPCMGLCEQLPPQPNDKLRDYLPAPRFVGVPHPMTTTEPGTRAEVGLAGPGKDAVCAPAERFPIEQGPHEGASVSEDVSVGLLNGELRMEQHFLHVDSKGFPFDFIGTYTSRATTNAPLGANWLNNYNDRRVYVIPDGSGNVSVIDGLGREDTYLSQGGGNFTSPAGIFDKLVRNGNSTYTQVNSAGITFQYDVDGFLTSLFDRAGNSLSFTRNGFHNIATAVDSQGRGYTFSYSPSGGGQQLDSITDSGGRAVVFTHLGGNLTQVRSPIVTALGSCDPNNPCTCNQAFPSGKTTTFTYSSGLGDPRLNNNLISVTDFGSASAKATFTYATTLDATAVDYDHVTSILRGAGGVGGTSGLVYSRQFAGDPDAPGSAFSRTTVTDANGNIKVAYFDVSRHLIRFIERTNRSIRPGEGDYTTSFGYSAEGLLTTVTLPRGNSATFLYDSLNPRRQNQWNLLEFRRLVGTVGGSPSALVRRFTHDPVYNRIRTITDERAFPTGSVPLDGSGHLNLTDPLVSRYTTTTFFDYQEGTGFQAAQGIAIAERIPEGLGDLNADLSTTQTQGNFVKVQYPTITAGPNAGQVISTLRTSNSSGQTLKTTDPEGHVSKFDYFPPGDSFGRAHYLQRITRDDGGFALKTEFDRDVRGNPKSVTHPKGLTASPPPTPGQDALFFYNELDQLVRSQSRQPFAPASTARYQTDFRYDANDDLVQKCISNQNETGAAYPHGVIVHTFTYNLLHYTVTETFDKSLNDNSQTGSVTWRLSYDANLNVIAKEFPLAVSGSVPNNIITTLRDERDLPYKGIVGDNDTNPANVQPSMLESPPANAVVTTENYDANGNLQETIDSIRNTQHSFAPTTLFPGSAAGDVIRRQYDGFDRLVKIIDGEGNEHATGYDLVSNPIQSTLQGPVDHAATTLSLLTQTDTTFDELSRAYQVDWRHFVTKTGVNVGDGHRITQMKYDKDGKILEVTDDRGLKTTTQWDTADRKFKTIDQLLNEMEHAYDANGNITSTTERDLSTDLGSGLNTFVTTFEYDGVDRVRKSTDNAGDANEVFFDSRGDIVKTSDAVRGAGQPTGPGNIVRHDFDALNRKLTTERVLTSNGRGDGSQTGLITTRQVWDDDSRLVSQTDDNNHVTSYVYDGLNRMTGITYADLTTRTTQFDTDNHLIQWTDQNGTTVAMTYDGVNRLLGRTLGTHPAFVIGGTFETFGYDGNNRVTHAVNDDGIMGSMTCDFEYDSLSNRTKDQQGALSVDSVYDGVSNRTQITYPGQFGGGRRVLTQSFDNLNRLQSICDVGANSICDSGETIATKHYKGPHRLERGTYGSDATPISKLDVGYDTLPRIVDMNHRTGANAMIAEFQYGFDRMSHRLFEKRVHDANLGDVYSYDSIYRVTRNPQAIDLTAIAPGTEIDPAAYAGAANRLEYAYDGVGNRTTSTQVLSAVPTVTTYTQTVDGALKDAEANQYTMTQEGALPVKNYTYDDNGNLISDGTRKYAYDFKNRMVEVRNQGTNALIAQYSYDSSDRRSMKMIAGGTTTEYLYDGLKIAEERDGTNAITRQYVWGDNLDNLLQERTAGATYYSHENSIGSIAALTNSTGTVVERYRYDPFGNTTLPLDGGTGNRIRFHGAYFDDETAFYFMRHRSYSPALGRFLQRDPIGIWTDKSNLGNGYTLARNDSVNLNDPLGLQGGHDPDDPRYGGRGSDELQQEKSIKDLQKQVEDLGRKYEDLKNRIENGGGTDDVARQVKELEKQNRELLERVEELERRSKAGACAAGLIGVGVGVEILHDLELLSKLSGILGGILVLEQLLLEATEAPVGPVGPFEGGCAFSSTGGTSSGTGCGASAGGASGCGCGAGAAGGRGLLGGFIDWLGGLLEQ
jgi:RHS repeat-associated core domain